MEVGWLRKRQKREKLRRKGDVAGKLIKGY